MRGIIKCWGILRKSSPQLIVKWFLQKSGDTAGTVFPTYVADSYRLEKTSIDCLDE